MFLKKKSAPPEGSAADPKLHFGRKKRESPDGSAAGPKLHFSRKKLTRKRVVLFCILGIVLIGAGYGLFHLFFAKDEAVALTDVTTYGALTKTIEGSGTVLPADSQIITAASKAEIQTVYISAGDTVKAGDPIYTQDDSEVDQEIEDYKDDIADAQLELDDYYDQLEEAQEGAANLVVYAPFSGRVVSLSVEADDDVTNGAKLATLVDDSTLTLIEYFSYAYEDDVSVGMAAKVSVPDAMLELDATVTDIKKVDYLTADGMRCFAVTITVMNPGSLTDGMSAAGWLTASDGTEIYPADDDATLTYANTKIITSGATGTVESVDVSAYQQVAKGQKLLAISSDTYEKKITSITNYIERLTEKIASDEEQIEEAEESRENYAVCADIDGKVIYCSVEPGDTPNTSNPIVAIYNLESVSISVNIDEADIDYLSTGMEVRITRSGAETDTYYTGTITELSLEASSSNGVAYFPCTITIDSNGELSAGVNVSYSISVGDTEEGVLAPVSALKSTSDGYCLMIQADSRPDNAIDLGEDVDIPDGFYAVPVEVGTSNDQYVHVTGVDEGVTVFLRYQQSAPSGGDSTSEDLSGDDTSNQFQGGPGGNFSGGGPSGMQSGGFTNSSSGGRP